MTGKPKTTEPTQDEIRDMVDEWGLLEGSIAGKAAKAEALKKKIFAWLKKHGKKIRIEGDIAIATRFSKPGDRQVTVAAFLKAAAKKTKAERDACLKVEIRKAEELLGKTTVNDISDRPPVMSNSLELKNK